MLTLPSYNCSYTTVRIGVYLLMLRKSLPSTNYYFMYI